MAQDSTDSLLLITQQTAKLTGNLTLQNQLLQQWISLTIGSNTGSLLNLLNSELETFNLASSTFFYNGYPSSVPQANNVWALYPSSGNVLAGVINPANLKFTGHFQGTGTYAPTALDVPVYKSNNSYLRVTVNESSVQYDTTNKVFGSSSLSFSGSNYLQGGTGIGADSGELSLSNYDWQLRGYFRFSSLPGSSTGTWMTLWTFVDALEIQATSTGLQVRYAETNDNFSTVISSSFTWSTDTFYYISVRRTNNILYFYINGVAYGTVSLSGVTVTPGTGFFYLGSDSALSNKLTGNIQEVEWWTSNHDVDTAPGVARTAAFVPAVDWISGTAYIASGLTAINAIVMIDQITLASFGVPTVNTGWQFNISCNNGTTWTNMPLTSSGNLSTLTTMFVGSIVATKLTNTNQLKYQIVSPSGKVIKCDGVLLNWQ